jgi:hypothetical protein
MNRTALSTIAVVVSCLAGCFEDPVLGEPGSACPPNGQCPDGMVCAFGSCHDPFGLGEDCDMSAGMNTCGTPLSCVDGTCQEVGGLGQPCDPWDEGDGCDDGLDCEDGECVEPPEPPGEWVAQPGHPSKQWLRCPLGSLWDGYGCTGTATELTWYPALEACPSGSQVPSLDDFIAILDDCDNNVLNHSEWGGSCNSCGTSEICDQMFTNEDVLDEYHDNLKSGTYWTRTVGKDYGGDAKYAFKVDFSGGSHNIDTNPNWMTWEEHTLCIKY